MDTSRILAFVCIFSIAPAECKAIDLIQLPGTQHSLTFTRTGNGSSEGPPEYVYDGDFESYAGNSSSGSHEGHVDDSRIFSEHIFAAPVKVEQVVAKIYAFAESDGSTEYPRGSYWQLFINVKRVGEENWTEIESDQSVCQHTNPGPVVCTVAPTTFDFSNLAADDVTALQFIVGAGGHRVGGEGYTLSTERLYELQVFGVPAPVLPGDYNGDGLVDAVDYTVWRNHLGESDEANLNYNGDGGDVSESDYTFWKQRYGDSGTGSGSGALTNNSVPEPISMTILLWIALPLFLHRSIGCQREC